MSKFRALLVSSLLATSLIGGAMTISTSAEAKAPAKAPITLKNGGDNWCC